MYCFCRHLLWSTLAKGNAPLQALSMEFGDGESHCSDWFKDYSVQQSLLYAVPFSILFVNWVSKTILRLMTHLEGY